MKRHQAQIDTDSQKDQKDDVIIGVCIIISVLFGIVDRVYYIKFLHQSGFTYKDIFVPWSLFFEYHFQFPGSILFSLCIVPAIIAFSVLYSPSKKQKAGVYKKL